MVMPVLRAIEEILLGIVLSQRQRGARLVPKWETVDVKPERGPAWEADTLPTELLPLGRVRILAAPSQPINVPHWRRQAISASAGSIGWLSSSSSSSGSPPFTLRS